MTKRVGTTDELIDVRRAAVLVGRHPETVRRWVWSGRLRAQRNGRRLLVARSEVQAIAEQDAVASSLREWADQARAVRNSTSTMESGRSAADLVIEDRLQRSGIGRPRARR
jgi:excisionase family DNA binding protein